MARLEELGTVIETDVLVIGSGIAGLFAAVRAKDFVKDVTLVDKGQVGHTSQCYFALGGHQVFLPGHDMDAWVKEVMYFEDGLCEQDLVESVYRDTFDRVRDLERYGVRFIEGPDMGYRLLTTRGLEHIRKVYPYPRLAGGIKEIESLYIEAERLGVRCLSKLFIVSLLKQGDAVIGAVGIDRRSGRFYIFKAGAVVIATGQCSFKGQYAAQLFLTGDGMIMALQAGAELKNMEFHTLWLQPSRFVWEALGTAFPMGAVLLNAKGEAFMDRYCPVLKSEIDYNFQARAMAMEAREGRGPFRVDYGPIKPEDKQFLKADRHGWMALHIDKLHSKGEKPFDEPWEIMPVFWTVQGIYADINCRTHVPGLFVGGRVRSIDPGVTMGSWSIGTATVLGYRAGEQAAKYAGSRSASSLNAGEVKALKSEIYSPLGKEGIEPEEVLLEIQNAVFPWDITILKNEASLKRALSRIETIRDELLPHMGAADPHYLVELLEVKNMTLVAEAMLRASLMRTESRASHYREDYPTRDNENWLKWILVGYDGKKMNLRTVPLPMDKYKFTPSRYYSDNFRIPK
ncbi:MAG: FAD-binding protein [Dehalococcoidia bacterium]|nr:FAD-binding protein [Dehalococcoidia bacterium]